jgi:glycyl-tRNA synthetase beta chain
VWTRIEAVKAFRRLPEAESLASANKRIQNILKKSGTGQHIDASLFKEGEEASLAGMMKTLEPVIEGYMSESNFADALKALAGLRASVDAFFDKVLVNAEDENIRNNRLALLTRLGALMNRVADISKLAA